MKKTEKLIYFRYMPCSGRTEADSQDIYNWLLDRDVKVAEEFRKKSDDATKMIKKSIKK